MQPFTRSGQPNQPSDYVLVVDDDPWIRKAIRRQLERNWPQFEVYTVENAIGGFTALLELGAPRLLICDQRMGDGGPGLRLLDYCAEHNPETRRILFTAFYDGEIALASARHVVVEKGADPKRLLAAVRTALQGDP